MYTKQNDKSRIPMHKTEIGPCMDVASDGEVLYAIQNMEQFPTGRVCKTDGEGKLLCEARGIGNARQIGIDGDVLVVSARENGLWILSRKDLKILCHYQTVEFATGVTLCHPFAFISCRQFGVEIIDLTDPCRPEHIGLIRIGEVQSACIWNGYLFGGLWGEMCVAVVDIRDLSEPRTVAKIELQGRGDGVTVRDGILWAAIGQHRRNIRNTSDENDACYGRGNGYEVFDVRDPGNIKKIRTVFTEKAYYPSFDTWKTYLSGDVLLLTNSVLGLYAYLADDGTPLYHIPVEPVDGLPDAVTGVAVCGGKLFIATGRGGLFAADDPSVHYAPIYVCRDTAPARVPPHRFVCDSDRLTQVYKGNRVSVLGLCKFGEGLALACGSAGIVLLDRSFAEIRRIATDGFCCAVGRYGNLLFSAESDAGFSVYQVTGTNAEKLASLTLDDPVTQLFADPDGRYVLLGGGSRSVSAVSLQFLPELRVTAVRTRKSGPLYGDNFARHTLSDGTAVLFWHRDGLVTYNPDFADGFREFFIGRRVGFMGFGPGSGIDTDGENIFYNLGGGLIRLPMRDNVCADDLERNVPEYPIRGKFLLTDHILVACERARGEITVTDLSDARHPHSLFRIWTNVSCGQAYEIDGKILIPAAHAGLLRLDVGIS